MAGYTSGDWEPRDKGSGRGGPPRDPDPRARYTLLSFLDPDALTNRICLRRSPAEDVAEAIGQRVKPEPAVERTLASSVADLIKEAPPQKDQAEKVRSFGLHGLVDDDEQW